MTTDTIKARATALSKRLSILGLTISHGHALEAVAVSLGHPNWSTLRAALDQGDSSAKPTCQRCTGELEQGYCKDEACPYCSWPQSVPLAEMFTTSTIDLEKKYHVRKRHPAYRASDGRPDVIVDIDYVECEEVLHDPLWGDWRVNLTLSDGREIRDCTVRSDTNMTAWDTLRSHGKSAYAPA